MKRRGVACLLGTILIAPFPALSFSWISSPERAQDQRDLLARRMRTEESKESFQAFLQATRTPSSSFASDSIVPIQAPGIAPAAPILAEDQDPPFLSSETAFLPPRDPFNALYGEATREILSGIFWMDDHLLVESDRGLGRLLRLDNWRGQPSEHWLSLAIGDLATYRMKRPDSTNPKTDSSVDAKRRDGLGYRMAEDVLPPRDATGVTTKWIIIY